MIKLVKWPVLLALVAWAFWSDWGLAWQAASISHPLGTDEFGRDVLATALAAILASGVKGAFLTCLALGTGGAVGYAIAMLESRTVAWAVAQLTLVIESVPLLLWLLVMIVAIPEPMVILVLGFTIGTLPFVSRVVAGEIERWKREPFVEASRIAGASKLYVTRRHILPNGMPTLGPVAVQICGAAAAADGAFGLVGLSNRTQLDIGTLLLRSKENALMSPHLLLVAVAAVGLLYLYLWHVSNMWDGAERERPITFGPG